MHYRNSVFGRYIAILVYMGPDNGKRELITKKEQEKAVVQAGHECGLDRGGDGSSVNAMRAHGENGGRRY